jgi:uncharacterized protein with HEPN domain
MRREILLLEEMIDAAEQAERLVQSITTAELEQDRTRRDALLWNFTVLGEASAQLPTSLTQRFPEVPWRQPSLLRNRIVHGYWSTDMNVLHTTAQDQLPEFTVQLRRVMSVLVREEASGADSLNLHHE